MATSAEWRFEAIAKELVKADPRVVSPETERRRDGESRREALSGF